MVRREVIGGLAGCFFGGAQDCDHTRTLGNWNHIFHELGRLCSRTSMVPRNGLNHLQHKDLLRH
jgi:hypothetical protein